MTDFLKPDFSNIPDELKALKQWVCWKPESSRDGKKPDKVPYNAMTGSKAKINDSTTWGSFDAAMRAYSGGRYDGLFFALSGDDPFTGIDLDHCRDAQSGVIAPWAQTVINRLNSYTEISPSGTGIRIFVKAVLSMEGRKKGDIEVYDATHFLSVTGHRIPETPSTIESRQDEINKFHREVFGDRERQSIEFERTKLTAESRKRILKAMTGEKFKALYEGDFSAYPSQSEGDQSLCNMLAF